MGNSSFQEPGEDTLQRNSLPEHLYMPIAATYPVNHNKEAEVLARRPFSLNHITKDTIEAHLIKPATPSPFFSVYSKCATACEIVSSAAEPSRITIITIDPRNLVPGWVVTSDKKVPVWIEQGPFPRTPRGIHTLSPEGYDAFETSYWICVDEVRSILGLNGSEIEGEWLACGKIPARMVVNRERVIVLEQKKLDTPGERGFEIEAHVKLMKEEARPTHDHATQTEQLQFLALPRSRSSLDTEEQTTPPTRASPPLRLTQPSRRAAPMIPINHFFPSIASVLSSTPNPPSSSVAINITHPTPTSFPALAPTAFPLDANLLIPDCAIPATTRDSYPPSTPRLQSQHDALPTDQSPPPDPEPPSTPRLQPIRDPETCLPTPPLLLHPPIRSTSPLSKRSADTLKKLEECQLNGEAIKMWIGEVKNREEEGKERRDSGRGNGEDSGKGKGKGKGKRDVWDREE